MLSWSPSRKSEMRLEFAVLDVPWDDEEAEKPSQVPEDAGRRDWAMMPVINATKWRSHGCEPPTGHGGQNQRPEGSHHICSCLSDSECQKGPYRGQHSSFRPVVADLGLFQRFHRRSRENSSSRSTTDRLIFGLNRNILSSHLLSHSAHSSAPDGLTILAMSSAKSRTVDVDYPAATYPRGQGPIVNVDYVSGHICSFPFSTAVGRGLVVMLRSESRGKKKENPGRSPSEGKGGFILFRSGSKSAEVIPREVTDRPPSSGASSKAHNGQTRV
ncbi:hypothetical protein V8F33_002102 [Rhypophila sp. PSN 637]